MGRQEIGGRNTQKEVGKSDRQKEVKQTEGSKATGRQKVVKS
jgi:hypothetical protein